MRLTAILLTVVCMQASASGWSQNITCSVRDVPLKKVFEVVEEQTAYFVIYDSATVSEKYLVSVNVSQMPLDIFLTTVFEHLPLSFLIQANTIVIIQKPELKSAASNPLLPIFLGITGKVVNEKGEPVAGASIAVKGSSQATATDETGEFRLNNIPENAILLVSGINIETTEIKVRGKEKLLIKVQTKVSTAEAVTVVANTGYQTLKPNEINGSVVIVDNKKLNEQTGTNILRRLDGMVPGLRFDNKPTNNQQRKLNVTIRGLHSIEGPIDPLIVLDGVIYEGNIDNINPNIVESITVLKDASAAAIWGARSGNGVIVITTKKGQFNQKMQVDFSANAIVASKPDLFSQSQISSADFIDIEEIMFQKGYYEYTLKNYPYYASSPAVKIFNKRKKGLISAADSASQIDGLKQTDLRNEIQKYIYGNAVKQQYAVNVRGGSSNNSYTFSVAFDKSLDEIKSSQNKLTIRLANSFRPTKNMDIDFSVIYTNNIEKSGKHGFGLFRVFGRAVPYLSLADAAGKPLPVDLIYNGDYTDTAGAGKLLDWKFYPLLDYKHSTKKNNTQDIVSTVQLTYRLTSFLRGELSYSYQKEDGRSIDLSDRESYLARNLINSYTQLNRATGELTYIVPIGGIRGTDLSSNQSYTARAQLNFRKSWKLHTLSGLMGVEARQKVLSANAEVLYGYNEDPYTVSNVDIVNSYPHFLTGDASYIGGDPTNATTTDRFVSLYGIFGYNYKGTYSFSATVRKDGSNLLGANTNDRWEPQWSAGAGWEITREQFFRNNWFSNLRLRASYGYNGSIDLHKTALPIAQYQKDQLTLLPYARISVLNNPDLKWERIGKLNIGLDFSLTNNFLSGMIEYFQKHSTDLYGRAKFDYTGGGSSQEIVKNIAAMKGLGVEAQLQARWLQKKIQWSTSINFTWIKERTTSYYSRDATRLSTKLGDGTYIVPVIGKALYAIAAYRWGGLDKEGDPQSYVNGQLSKDYDAIFREGFTKGDSGNIVFVGPSNPTKYGAIINRLNWKGFGVSVAVSYSLGYYFRKPVVNYSALIRSGMAPAEVAQRWKKPGDEKHTNVPAFMYDPPFNRDYVYNYSDINILKGDHIRLQYVNLSYTFSQAVHKRLPLKGLECYFNAAGLGILWRANNQGLDPENPESMALVKSFTFGIRGNF